MDGWRADLDAPVDGGPPPAARRRRALPAVLAVAGAAALVATSAVAFEASGPDCAGLLRGPAGRDYVRLLGGGAPLDGAAGAELERLCGRPSPPGLAVLEVVVDAGEPRWLVARTTLANRTPMALAVTAVDVADVNAVAMADRAVLPAGGRGTLAVRVPVRTCTYDRAPDAPQRWGWSVGPAGADPAALVTTPLPQPVRDALATAVRERCGPAPDVRADVVGARVVPDFGPRDTRARSVRLTLRVASPTAATVLLGDPPAGLTADARPRFTAASVPPGRTTTVEVVWRTRCGAEPVTSLPATARIDGVDHTWSVTVDGAAAARSLARSCR